VSLDANTGRHSVVLKTSDGHNLFDNLSVNVEGQEVKVEDAVDNEVKGHELQDPYLPTLVSAGKHKVSQMCYLNVREIALSFLNNISDLLDG